MAVKPIDPRRTVDYVLKRDTGDPPTTWKLRPLTKLQWLRIYDDAAELQMDATGAREIVTRIGLTKLGLVRSGLAGVDGFPGWEDEVDRRDPSVKVPTLAFLNTIHNDDFLELAEAIDGICTVTEDDAGKSSPPST